MSKAEEQFMLARERMTECIKNFYAACKLVDISDEGFAEDVVEKVDEATDGNIKLELY